MGYVRTAGMSTSRRRARRRTALVIMGLLLALALALLVSLATVQGWFGLGGDGSTDDVATSSAPAPEPALAPADVTVNVLNGAGTSGLAGRTAEAIGVRGFDLGDVDNADALEGVGEVRHGPEGAEAAELLVESLGQDFELVMDERQGTEVDLVLGPEFEELPSAEDTAETDGR